MQKVYCSGARKKRRSSRQEWWRLMIEKAVRITRQRGCGMMAWLTQRIREKCWASAWLLLPQTASLGVPNMASSECNKLANGEVMRSAAGEMGWGYRTERNGRKHVIQHNTTHCLLSRKGECKTDSRIINIPQILHLTPNRIPTRVVWCWNYSNFAGRLRLNYSKLHGVIPVNCCGYRQRRPWPNG